MDVRRLVLRGTPVAFGVVSLLHPVSGSRPIVEALEPDLRLNGIDAAKRSDPGRASDTIRGSEAEAR